MSWNHTVTINYLLTEAEDHASVQAEMKAIADILAADTWFTSFDFTKFYKIPKGDDTFGPVDYANRLLDHLYDYADAERIWIA